MSPSGTHLDHPEANTAFLRPKRNTVRERASSRNHKSTPRVVSLSLSLSISFSLSLSLSLSLSVPHSMTPRMHSIVSLSSCRPLSLSHCPSFSRSLPLSLTAPLSLALSLSHSLSLTATLSLSLPRLGLHLDSSAATP